MVDATDDPNIYILDHTADMGFEARGQTLSEVFEKSALALTTILTDPALIACGTQVEVDVLGSDLDSLMYNWLSEILYLFDGEKKLFSVFQVAQLNAGENGYNIHAKLSGEDYQPDRHEVRTYIKAITFHQMEILQIQPNCSARVFIDI